MPETPETEARIVKIQKDIEQLKEFMKDSWYERREIYKRRVSDVLSGYPLCVRLWLEIDGVRSINEIEKYLNTDGQTISHVTLWRCSQRFRKAGLITKVGVKSRSPIYIKKPWVEELHIDDYVRETVFET